MWWHPECVFIHLNSRRKVKLYLRLLPEHTQPAARAHMQHNSGGNFAALVYAPGGELRTTVLFLDDPQRRACGIEVVIYTGGGIPAGLLHPFRHVLQRHGYTRTLTATSVLLCPSTAAVAAEVMALLSEWF